MTRLFASFLACASLLVGCGTQRDAQTPLDILINRVRGAQPETVQRFARLVRDDAEVLQVGFVDQGARINMLLERRDGPFEYWLSANGQQIVLQHGMVHSTYGFGEGLLASDLSQPLSLIRARRSGYADRFHTFLDGNDRAVTRTYRCLIESEGVKSIELGGGSQTTVLMTENCRSLDQEFTNFYWVIPSTGQIIQSRQWSGPVLEALSTRAALR